MRSLIVAVLGCLLVSCISCTSFRRLPEVAPGEPAVFVQVYDIETKEGSPNEWVHLYFSHNVSGYEGFVQEVAGKDGDILVEYFHGRRTSDHHWRSESDTWSVCIVYPATVEGIDATPSGWGHLPQNRTGSVVTNVGPEFNSKYQKNYETRGIVVKDARHLATTWTVSWTGGKASYEIQEGMELK